MQCAAETSAVIGLLSAVIGGLIVLAGQWLSHALAKADRVDDRKYEEEARIVELALSVVNWLEMDKHRVFQAAGGNMPEIEFDHPVHKLVAALRRSKPDLADSAAEILKCFREYGDVTRVLIPHSDDKEERDGLTDRFAAAANRLIELLSGIVETTLPVKPVIGN